MFKITHTAEEFYTEAPQPNPLRWQLMLKNADGVFESQTHTLKCRDFFNDVVSARNGFSFHIYGFDSSTLSFNEEGLYILLSNVHPMWEKNATTMVSPEMEKAWGIPLTYSKHDDKILVLIPNQALANTYSISLLTLLLRYCNYGIELSSLEDCFKSSSVCAVDPAIKSDKYKAVLKYRLSPPEESRDYWWYFDQKYNSKGEGKPSSHTIHNNGVSNWLTSFLKAV